MEELDIKELFNIFWNRKIYMILIVIVFVLVGIVYTLTMVKPMYTSSITILLAKVETTNENSNDSDAITQADITLNQKLLPTYKGLVKSRAVEKQVKENLGLNDNEKINVSIELMSEDSEILKISVLNNEPEKAAKIANEVAKVFSQEVTERFNIKNISIVDAAEPDYVPSNVNHSRDIMVATFIGLVIAVIYALLANMLDTTIKTQEDIEKHVKLTVLAEIPLYESDVQNKKGGRK